MHRTPLVRAPRFRAANACATLLLLAASGCVSENAGYDDVRRLTSERIHKDVRWEAREARTETEKRTRALLQQPLDADRAVEVALLNNAELQAAFEELGTARAELVGALRVPNPTADVAFRFHGDEPTTIELHVLESLSGLLLLPARGGAAEKGLDAAKVSVAGKILDVALSARLAFYEYQAAAQVFELRLTAAAAARASYDMAQKLEAAGNISELEFTSERASYEEARIALSRAEARRASQREALNAALGLFGEAAGWRAEARLPDAVAPDALLANLERRALEKSLDLEIAKLEYEGAAKRANVARADGLLPDLAVGVAAEREGDEWSWGPAAALEIPLFYQGQGAVDAELAEMRRKRKQHTATALRIRAVARGAAARLRAAAEGADFYARTLLPLRARIVEQTQLEVNAMSTGLFQLLAAKREAVTAGESYVALLLEYWSERARVEQLLAGRLPAGVSAEQPEPSPATQSESTRH